MATRQQLPGASQHQSRRTRLHCCHGAFRPVYVLGSTVLVAGKAEVSCEALTALELETSALRRNGASWLVVRQGEGSPWRCGHKQPRIPRTMSASKAAALYATCHATRFHAKVICMTASSANCRSLLAAYRIFLCCNCTLLIEVLLLNCNCIV